MQNVEKRNNKKEVRINNTTLRKANAYSFKHKVEEIIMNLQMKKKSLHQTSSRNSNCQ